MKPVKAAHLLSGLFCGVLCLPSMSFGAGPAADSDSEKREVADELRSREDPTILKRRIWFETEWNSFKDGSDNVEATLGVIWSWSPSPRRDWAVRLKVPYEGHVTGRTPGDSDANGLGDIKVAAGTAFRLANAWRAGVPATSRGGGARGARRPARRRRPRRRPVQSPVWLGPRSRVARRGRW